MIPGGKQPSADRQTGNRCQTEIDVRLEINPYRKWLSYRKYSTDKKCEDRHEKYQNW